MRDDAFIKTCHAAVELVLRSVKSLYEPKAREAKVIRNRVLYVGLKEEPRYEPDEVAIEDAYMRVTSLAASMYGIRATAIREEELFSFEGEGLLIRAKLVSLELSTALGRFFAPKFVVVKMHLPRIGAYEYLVAYLGIDKHPVLERPSKPKG